MGARTCSVAAVKIYTRAGDDGSTGVLGPGRIAKDAARVEAYGSVDELNAALGVAVTLDGANSFAAELAAVQSQLFQVGAELATTDAAALAKQARIGDDDVTALEAGIDRLEQELEPLTAFLVPGGSPLAAQLHFARTVCRRAERRVVTLARAEPVDPRLVRYLNRLADWLFVLARAANRRAGVEETRWRAPGRSGTGGG